MQPSPIATAPPSHPPHEGGIVPLGDFVVAPDGSLSERRPGARPALRFRWKGLPCAATLSADGLELRAEAGRVPSTARRDARRADALEAVRALPGALPPGWRMFLEADHRVGLGTTARIEAPATAPLLLTALVRFALALEPYRDRLATAGLEEPAAEAAASGGTVST